MRRWFFGFLAGMTAAFLLLVLAGVLSWRLQLRPPSLGSNTTLVLEIQGDIPEPSPADPLADFLRPRAPVTFTRLLRQIEKAEADPRITAILLKPSQVTIGWAKLQQLRRSLEQFQQRGKPVLAVLEVAGTREYFLASVAHQIFLSPVGFLDLKGMRAEVMFFKDTLAKIGVEADLERIGDYKNIADQFTENRMTPEFREVTTALLDSIYANFLETVAASRRRPPPDLRALIEQNGPFTADAALQYGLVEELLYADEVMDYLKKDPDEDQPRTISARDYQRVPRQDEPRSRERLALLYAVGDITADGDTVDPLASGDRLTPGLIEAAAESIAQDDSIKGVLVRIDSPGGDAFASESIWRSLMKLREKKPLVFSMSDTAASGGYLMAMTGDPIVAESTTLTGSIGIVYGKLNLRGLYDKLGVHKEIIRRGPLAAMDSDYGAYTPQERAKVQELMGDFYGKFLAHVAEARNMTPDAVDRVAQGRVWTGQQAREHGLVDDLGGFPRALEILKEKAGIPPGVGVDLVEFPRRRSLIEVLATRFQQLAARRLAGLPAGWEDWLAQAERLEALSRNPWWARLPWEFAFQ